MSISVVCPGCKKTLKAKNELAGKRVKCPGCGQAIVIPAGPPTPSAKQKEASGERFMEPAAEVNVAEIAGLFQQDLTLVETPQESSDEGTAALMAEVDGFPVLVAFTSTDHVRQFASSMPDMLNEDGELPTFVVAGSDFLSKLPDEYGVLLNPETDDSDIFPPSLVVQIKRFLRDQTARQALAAGSSGPRDARAQAIRQQGLELLNARGFRPAEWLPLPDVERQVRPAADIASRLMSLATVFTWASAPDDAVSSERVREAIKNNRLKAWFIEEEAKILALPRAQARKQHADAIGWKLENMWPLAWVLGFDDEPTIEASQISQSTIRALVFDFLAGLEATVDELVGNSKLRAAEEVHTLEDRFYCAHNAVRSAQLGNETVPEGFHPIVHGGAVHERRHSLTWCLSPNTDWDETDLST